MGKATNPRPKSARRGRQKPSAPRVIGANDNETNDNAAIVVRGVTLNASQARRLDAAERLRAQTDIVSRTAGLKAMTELEAEIEAARAKAIREIDEAETRGLAERRGDDVARSEEKDAPLKVTRDGLETMRSTGSISQNLYVAGMRYRLDFERVDAASGLTPPVADGARKHTKGGDGFQKKVLESELRIRAVHRTIAGVPIGGDAMPLLPPSHPINEAIWILDRVAGEGQNLRDLTQSGSVRTRLAAALVRALTAAAKVYEVA